MKVREEIGLGFYAKFEVSSVNEHLETSTSSLAMFLYRLCWEGITKAWRTDPAAWTRNRIVGLGRSGAIPATKGIYFQLEHQPEPLKLM
jgi:hypothetical protein